MTTLDRAAMTLALHMLRRGEPRQWYPVARARIALELGGFALAKPLVAAFNAAVRRDTPTRLLRARLALYLRAALRDTSHTHFVCIRGAFGGLFQVGPMSRQRAIEMARGDSCRTVRPVRPLWTQAPPHKGER